MKIFFMPVFITILYLYSGMVPAGIKENERETIPEKYKWDLTHLFPSVEAWQQAKDQIVSRFDKMSQFKGKIGNSGTVLFKALDYYFKLRQDFYLFYTYALQLSDQDIRKSGPLSMKQEAAQLETQFEKNSAFIRPEILSISSAQIGKFMMEEPRLKVYAQYIDNIQRLRDFTLSQEAEALVAEAGRVTGTAQDIFTVFSNADMPRPTVILSDGKTVRLDPSGYSASRASAVRSDRVKIFDAFFGAFNEFRRTFGTQLYGEIQKNIFYKNARGYNSCLDRALNTDNIPTAVYHKLIENTHRNLPTLHRYLQLRKRMLGVDELHYYDMYPSLVKEVDLKYDYDAGTKIIKTALNVLGPRYSEALDLALNRRWIDVFPNTGKRSGAYSTDHNYGAHPYILMNYNGNYEDLSTLAHELGHALHSHFSNEAQPYVNSLYPIFLAEVASTANEALLIDHELQRLDHPDQRLSLLGSYLEQFRTTLFRQTQFAEFELRIHEEAEKGNALSGDRFTEIYLDILEKYYGHDQGVTIIDELYAMEWAYIPHFYYNFYVYQYSTSFLASQALVEKILGGNTEMITKYITFLSSGSSEYPIPTLKKVGIDMTADEPFDLAMQKMNKIMDEIEAILSKQKN